MVFTLRTYQQELVEQTNDLLLAGRKPCLVSATGSGKTVVLAELVRLSLERGEDIVVAAHRHQIVKQLIASIGTHTGERIGILTAKHTTPRRRITISMMPTLARRKSAIELLKGRTLLIDEAHHIASPSWRRVVAELEPLRFGGATATPISPSGGGLGKYGIDDLVLGPQSKWLMEQGNLAKYRLFAATSEVDTEGVTVRGGDFAVNELAERVIEINGDIIRDYERFNPKSAPTIVATVTVEHAYEVAQLYIDAGYSAQVIVGDTPEEIRQHAFKRFEAGELKVIVSVACLDEGLDLCSATCLQLLRPTRSLRLWRQLVGRVLRPSPGKEHALILDHGHCWEALGLPDDDIAWSLTDKPKRLSVPRELDEDREVVSRPEKIENNGAVLSEIDPAFILGQRLVKRSAALRKNMYLCEYKGFNAAILRPFALNPQGVSPEDRRRIERLMNLPEGFCDRQELQVV